MRYLRAVLAAGLASSFCVASEAPVYTFGKTAPKFEPGRQVPSLSPSNARLYLAQRLGLSQYHNLKDADEATLGLLNQDAGTGSHLFDTSEDEAKAQRTLIFVSGVEKTYRFFGREYEPVFTITDPPSSPASIELVEDLLDQDRHRRGASTWCKTNQPKRALESEVHGGFSNDEPLGTCMPRALDDFSFIDLATVWGERTMLLNMDTHQILSDLTIDELQAMYRENPSTKLRGTTGVYHMSGLQKIADNEGIKSQKYNQAVHCMRQIMLNSLTEMTVVLLPLSQNSAKSTSDKPSYGSYSKPSSRQQLLQQQQTHAKRSTPLSTTNNKKRQSSTNNTTPNTLIPTCYNSNSTCVRFTNNCSSHGACFKKYTEMVSDDEEGPECWTCGCVPSVIKQSGGGQKTIYWGGPACQKQDISVEFWLFAGFGVAILMALTTAVGMLYEVGEGDLPSVLGAGVAAAGMRK